MSITNISMDYFLRGAQAVKPQGAQPPEPGPPKAEANLPEADQHPAGKLVSQQDVLLMKTGKAVAAAIRAQQNLSDLLAQLGESLDVMARHEEEMRAVNLNFASKSAADALRMPGMVVDYSAGALKETTGIQGLALPDKIDRETYDALVAFKADPAHETYLDAIRPRLSEGCYRAAASRLDDVIARDCLDTLFA